MRNPEGMNYSTGRVDLNDGFAHGADLAASVCTIANRTPGVLRHNTLYAMCVPPDEREPLRTMVPLEDGETVVFPGPEGTD